MDDQSHLDSKYFIDRTIYNCPFCNRRHVSYSNLGHNTFNWSKEKACEVWRIECDSCKKISMHLTFLALQDSNYGSPFFKRTVELDEAFFYSVPTSFFVIDRRIHNTLRELITEAEGCAKMNYLTGASACTRKAIYELLDIEGAVGEDYDARIKNLAAKFPAVDAELFEVLGHIKDMTSEKVHEQSWDAWDSTHLHLFLETLKTALQEIYVVPDERKSRVSAVRALREKIAKSKSASERSDPDVPGSDNA